MSRKSKKHVVANVERNANLGVKKTEKQKIKKNALLKALSNKSLNLTVTPASGTGKKKRRHRKRKAVNPQSVIEQNKAPVTVSPKETEQPQKVPITGGGKKKKTRKRNKGNKASSEAPKQTSLAVVNKVQNQPSTECGKKRKRRNRKKASAEALTNSKSAGNSSNPSKKVKFDKALEEASSDSEPELISADWGLAYDSDEEGDVKLEDDLHTSEEDKDEKAPDDDTDDDDEDDDEDDDDDDDEGDDDDDGDNDEELDMDSDEEESTVETTAKKCNVETEKSQQTKSKENKQAIIEDPNSKKQAAKKRFSINDKPAILSEMLDRMANFDARSLYISPIPSDCTFDMLKKFIPRMKTCRFFVKPKSTKLRTFVFVEFADPETAAKEKLSISGRLFANRPVRAELRSTQQGSGDRKGYTVDRIDFSRIIVSGLSSAVNQIDLKRVFTTAESIRLPMSTQNFNYGYATLNYVSHEVALDAFSQCHGFILKGHPISVNFVFKAPEKKQTGISINASSSKSDTITRSQPVQCVGKAIVQSMANTETEEEELAAAASFKMKKQLNEKKTAAQGKDATKVVAKAASTSVLSGMIKQAKEMMKNNEPDDKESEEEEESEEHSDDDDAESEDDSKTDDDADEEMGDDNSTNVYQDEEEDSVSTLVSGEEDEMEPIQMPMRDDSEGEEIDASLAKVLNARRVCAKAVKAPGAKRNWKTTDSKKRPPTSMPKTLPVPTKRWK